MFGEEGYFRDRSMDYKQAKQGALLQVPDAYEHDPIQPLLTVPPVVHAKESFDPKHSDQIPRPQIIVKSNAQGSLQLKRAGEMYWIWTQMPMNQIWPHVQAFWQAQAVELERVDAAQGVLETAWIQSELIKEERGFFSRITHLGRDQVPPQRYQVRLRGSGLAGTEIMLQRQLAQGLWQQDEVSGKVMQAMMDYLIQKLDTAPVQEQLQDVDQPLRVSLIRDGNGYPLLTLEQGFAHSWEIVGAALKRLGVRVEDLNRTLGIYYVRKPEEEGQPAGVSPLLLELRLAPSEQGTHLTVQLDDETLAPIEISEKLLGRLFELLNQDNTRQTIQDSRG